MQFDSCFCSPSFLEDQSVLYLQMLRGCYVRVQMLHILQSLIFGKKLANHDVTLKQFTADLPRSREFVFGHGMSNQ